MATPQTIWRIYCQGNEFGIDYPTRRRAQIVAESYRKDFPHLHYYVRRTSRPRISQLVSVPA